jgi:hypothetical protein
LCGVHNQHGEQYQAGLGFYAYLRFHIDSTKYRRWNMDPAVAAECPPIIHPEDVASVGQPLPPTGQPQLTPPVPAPPTSPAVATAPPTPAASPPQQPQPPLSQH